MEKNLSYYIRKYKAFDDNKCDEIVYELSNVEWLQHKFYNSASNTYASYDKELSISHDSINYTSYLERQINRTMSLYLEDLNFPWYSSYNQSRPLRFNRYEKNTLMREHCDHIHDMFDGTRKGIPVLSAVGLLNDNYKGGDLIFFGDTKIKLGKGQVVIFPSNFLFPHLVSEVTEGVRYTVVTWAW